MCVSLAIYLLEKLILNRFLTKKFINYLPNLEELDASFNSISKIDDVDSLKCRKVNNFKIK